MNPPSTPGTNRVKWVEETSQVNEDFMKICNEESDRVYFLEIYFQYPEKLHDFQNDLPFLPEKLKVEKVEKLVANL